MLRAIKVPYTAIRRNALAHTPANWIMARRRAAPERQPRYASEYRQPQVAQLTDGSE